MASLQRQNAQLQAQVSKASRHASSPSQVNISLPSELEAALASKSSTIESMEMEISSLRAKIDRSGTSTSVQIEQIAALEEKLVKSERAAEAAQRELADLKKNLERTSERAVKEGS